MKRLSAARLLAYVLLIAIAIIGFLPFVMIVIYSTKARIEILTVPPTLDFDVDQIVKVINTETSFKAKAAKEKTS